MSGPNPLLPRVPDEAMPQDLKDMREASLALRDEATFYEVMANNPDLLRWYINSFYGEVFKSGRVPVAALETLRLRLSAEHGCKFCNQGNRLLARAAGLRDGEVDALFGGDATALRSELSVVAQLADELKLTSLQGSLSPELYGALGKHYSPAEIVELGLIGGVLAGVAKFLFAFDLVEREASCPFPHPGEDSV